MLKAAHRMKKGENEAIVIRQERRKMNIGKRLKSIRLQAGLSQRDLAEMVGLSARAISKYERGMDTPSSADWIRLAKALGVHVEYFLRPIEQ